MKKLLIIILLLFSLTANTLDLATASIHEGTLQGFSMRCNSLVNDYIVVIVNNKAFGITKELYNKNYRNIGKKVIVYYTMRREINMTEFIYRIAYAISIVE